MTINIDASLSKKRPWNGSPTALKLKSREQQICPRLQVSVLTPLPSTHWADLSTKKIKAKIKKTAQCFHKVSNNVNIFFVPH
jgi:hypothetical protein